MSTYEIKLPQFQGPFDLLLFFIERDELDIYDIPIYKIADEFLEYLHQADALNIELASEFILVAATLMRIKAKMLLPRKELDQEGNEIDPRTELVQKLLEYKQIKGVVEDLQQLEEDRSRIFRRGNIEDNLKLISQLNEQEPELHSLTLFKLYHAFQNVLNKYEQEKNKVKHTVIQYPYTIEKQKEYLVNNLERNNFTSFETVFAHCENRIQALFNFLALLELIQLKTITIKLGEGVNNFWMKLA